MFNPNFNFGNTMPTSTQPYGYAMNGFNYGQQSQPSPQLNQTTNMIFVGSIEDVKGRSQMPNTEMFYADNEKPLLYKKTVYANGQFDVKVFDITEHKGNTEQKDIQPIDLSPYAKTSDLDAIRSEIKAIKDKLSQPKQGGVINGTTNPIKPTGTN